MIINESGHIHKHSPNGDVLMDFCHMESSPPQLCGVLKVVHPRVFPGSCSDKMAGFGWDLKNGCLPQVVAMFSLIRGRGDHAVMKMIFMSKTKL